LTTSVSVELLCVGSCSQRAWLVDGSRGAGWRRFPALVARIRHPRAGTILFDTGYGAALARATSAAARLYRRLLPFDLAPEEELSGQLGRLGLAPPELACVFLSHFHPDHIGGLRDAAGLRGVPIVHSREGLARLRRLRGPARLRAAFLPELLPPDFAQRANAIEDRPRVALTDDWLPFEWAHDLVGDGSLLAIALPGHALGQYGLLCQLARGRRLFLVADAAWVRANFADLALPAWPVRRFFADQASLVASLRALHALHLRQPELLIVPSHCEASQHAFAAGGYGE